jgi:hypothetical protein
MQLVQCQACERHVRVEEAVCPFCGVSRRIRVGRTVAVASAVVALALSAAAACDNGGDSVPTYGIAPMEDAGSADGGASDTG